MLVELRPEAGEAEALAREIVEAGRDEEPVCVLFPLEGVSGKSKARLTWKNAFGNRPLELVDVEVVFLEAESADSLALGSVGLIAADATQTSRLIRNIAAHHPHYRGTAIKLASELAPMHTPRSVCRKILSGDASRLSTGADDETRRSSLNTSH